LVNGNIKVTIPIHLKYDGCKTVIHQLEAEPAELDPETMSPLQKAVIQGFQYRDMLKSGKVATVLTLSLFRKGFPENWTKQRKIFGMK
jgi:hypothetical protein